MSKQNNPDYRWRPATKGDIGSVARFGDTDHEREPWTYGILVDVMPNPDDDADAPKWVFLCDDGNWESVDEMQGYFVCQIQYDGSKEP